MCVCVWVFQLWTVFSAYTTIIRDIYYSDQLMKVGPAERPSTDECWISKANPILLYPGLITVFGMASTLEATTTIFSNPDSEERQGNNRNHTLGTLTGHPPRFRKWSSYQIRPPCILHKLFTPLSVVTSNWPEVLPMNYALNVLTTICTTVI